MIKKDFYCDEILSGKINIRKIYESKSILAFYHTKPSYKIHVVIIPKKHILDLTSIKNKDKEIVWEIFKIAKKIIKNFNFNKDGAKFITNLGKYQESKHLRFHIISGEKIKYL